RHALDRLTVEEVRIVAEDGRGQGPGLYDLEGQVELPFLGRDGEPLDLEPGDLDRGRPVSGEAAADHERSHVQVIEHDLEDRRAAAVGCKAEALNEEVEGVILVCQGLEHGRPGTAEQRSERG